ncbi:MAG: FHA domain-containing serine/threonine-protein kinase [Planctomycetota bacterium]
MRVRFTAITRHEISTADLRQGTTIFGKDRACDHPLEDPTLERRHIAVTVGSAEIQMTDLQTRTGSYLNGRRVNQTGLKGGDRVRIGDTVLILSLLPELPPSAELEGAEGTSDTERRPPLIQDDERFFIRIAREWGLLNRARMRTILAVKNEDRLLGDERRVEEICVRRGYLTVSQVREIINIWERIVVRCRSCNSVFTPGDLERARSLRCPSCQEPLRGTLGFPGEDDVERRAAGPIPEAESRYLRPGEIFGGCRVERFVDEGGSAEVYTGIHLALNVRVAIKVLKGIHAVDWDRARHFVEEARRVARLDHPHIVQVLNVGFENGRYFILYQYVEGRPLAALPSDERRLPPERIRYIIAAAASGLYAAHRHGIVHGDVKPENILVGRNRVVKVTDFGVAQEARGEGSPESPLAGTHPFQAPEQEAGGPVDERCDIYSLGLVMRCLLLGTRPPEDHRYVDLPAPHEIDRTVPEALSLIAVKMLAKAPPDRYASMSEVIAALRAADPASQPQPAVLAPPKRHAVLHRVVRWAGLVALLLVAGTAGALLTMSPEHRARLFGRVVGRIGTVGGQLSDALVDDASASAETENGSAAKGLAQALPVPAYRPREATLEALRQAFAKRNFSEICRLVKEEMEDQRPAAQAYGERVLAFSQPLLGYTKLAAGTLYESYLQDRPVRFEEFQMFVLVANQKYVDQVRPGWWSAEIISERVKDLEFGGNDEDFFRDASHPEAEAYCLWLMDHPELSGVPYRFRLPLSQEVWGLTSIWNFWLGDDTGDPNTKRVYTRRTMVQDEHFEGRKYQPMIRLVLDVPLEDLKRFEEILSGSS